MTELGRFGISLSMNEISLSASVTPMHRTLLASYRMNAHRGQKSARDLILSDLRGFLDLGALERASDLLIVLALFLREMRLNDQRSPISPTSRRQREPISLQRWRAGQARSAYSVCGRRPKQVGMLAAANHGEVKPEYRLEPVDGDEGDARL